MSQTDKLEEITNTRVPHIVRYGYSPIQVGYRLIATPVASVRLADANVPSKNSQSDGKTQSTIRQRHCCFVHQSNQVGICLLEVGSFGIDKTGDPLKQQPSYLHVPVYLTYVKNTTATAPCGYLSYRVNGALR